MDFRSSRLKWESPEREASFVCLTPCSYIFLFSRIIGKWKGGSVVVITLRERTMAWITTLLLPQFRGFALLRADLVDLAILTTGGRPAHLEQGLVIAGAA